MTENKSLKIDLTVVIAIIVVSTFIILKFEVKPLISGIFYFLIPSIYLLLRKTKDIKNIFIGSLVFGLWFGFLFDFFVTFNKGWFVPQNQLIFPYRIFGVLPIDDVIWWFLLVLIMTIFYEHFIEKRKAGKLSKNLKYALLPSILIAPIIFILFFVSPNLLEIRYVYLVLGLIAIIPFIYLIIKKPFFISKFIKISIFFFFLFLIYELTALKLGQWVFPGEYIGVVEIFNLQFPFEEFFFWIMISSAACLSHYEIFVDDER